MLPLRKICQARSLTPPFLLEQPANYQQSSLTYDSIDEHYVNVLQLKMWKANFSTNLRRILRRFSSTKLPPKHSVGKSRWASASAWATSFKAGHWRGGRFSF
jgi:hypothetical protein